MVEIGCASEQSVAGGVGGVYGDAWYLLSVEVVHFNTGHRGFFLYDDWINDQRRRVQLKPGKVGENNSYKVTVKTSDIRGAGTDSNITFQLFGMKDEKSVDTGKHVLDDSANNFERNMDEVSDTVRGISTTFLCGEWLDPSDPMSLQSTLVKVLDTVRGISTTFLCGETLDPFGLMSLHKILVEVLDTVRGISTTFPCGEWLDPSDPMSLQKTLVPSGAKNPLLSDTRTNNFERGMKDVFQTKAVDIGELQYVIVRKDNSGLGADWHLQSVEIYHPALQKRYFLMCNDWLNGAVERKLEVGSVPTGGRCTYRIMVYTSDCRGAGTDSNVSMTLFGEKGDTGERKL
eukprot:gene18433-24909_t